MDYTTSELLAVLLSREVRDDEISACGALSQIPAAGLLLAQAMHAPNAELIILGSIFNPFRTSRQFHYLAQRGELGLFFASGVQIDRHGNYNLHQLGPDIARPQMRFPGGYGGGMIYYGARRTVVFRTEHTVRSLVEHVDYISAAGSTPPDVLRHGNPSKAITPKANFRFEKDAGVLRLDTVHPGYTLDDIRDSTGFDLGVNGAVTVTPAPTAEELQVLRQVIRTKMIDTGTYAEWARKSLGAMM
ncbi:MAG TPA: CoA-transferase [Burkholderiales bacterium]|nr:CoA-transferase [Burkholderiales bacterium]